jgi:protein-disulfide isomerase
VAKQWCILCLGVQLLLVLGAVHSVVFYGLPPLSFMQLSLYPLLLFALPVLAWYAIKPSLLKLQKAKTQQREHLRLKFNTEIFDTLLKKQKQITQLADGLGIVLGNPAAKYELIKVCNPYCGPCARAHPEIEKILEENKNVKARIIFNAKNEEDSITVKPVKHLLAIAANSNDEQYLKQSLDDWYLADKKDYDVFAARYPMNGELKEQDEKVDAMDKWCKTIAIQFTPTIFINGYQMPDAYSIKDINYFLLD